MTEDNLFKPKINHEFYPRKNIAYHPYENNMQTAEYIYNGKSNPLYNNQGFSYNSNQKFCLKNENLSPLNEFSYKEIHNNKRENNRIDNHDGINYNQFSYKEIHNNQRENNRIDNHDGINYNEVHNNQRENTGKYCNKNRIDMHEGINNVQNMINPAQYFSNEIKQYYSNTSMNSNKDHIQNHKLPPLNNIDEPQYIKDRDMHQKNKYKDDMHNEMIRILNFIRKMMPTIQMMKIPMV